jgi:hypothetical protein
MGGPLMAASENYALGLSGGHHSAALATYMRQNYLELCMEYLFNDTWRVLP